MPIITIDPAQPFEPQVDAAPEDSTILLPPGVTFTTKRVTLQVAPAPAPEPFTFTVSVNGRQVASEAVSRGDVVSIDVS